MCNGLNIGGGSPHSRGGGGTTGGMFQCQEPRVGDDGLMEFSMVQKIHKKTKRLIGQPLVVGSRVHMVLS